MKKQGVKNKKINFWVVLISCSLILFSYKFVEQQRIINQKKTDSGKLSILINEENKKNATLNEQLKAIDSDDYIEKEARKKLGLVKEGERIFYDINK